MFWLVWRKAAESPTQFHPDSPLVAARKSQAQLSKGSFIAGPRSSRGLLGTALL